MGSDQKVGPRLVTRRRRIDAKSKQRHSGDTDLSLQPHRDESSIKPQGNEIKTTSIM